MLPSCIKYNSQVDIKLTINPYDISIDFFVMVYVSFFALVAQKFSELTILEIRCQEYSGN